MIKKIDVSPGNDSQGDGELMVAILFTYSDEELAATTRNPEDDNIDFLKRLLLRDIFKIENKKEDAE